ncbi:hypothetical protein HOD20_03240 [archaeon]|jgi:hypothetical protein|nr:hypothetical protein [archaeon]MBT4351517.1 hypothetical protein [archaeon]MBT4648638.1 hypothetical protein [archaeon]MBT6822503.1 hypothetical protein [archaeon]MBT7392177.1 hypothetical protein [archaeon]
MKKNYEIIFEKDVLLQLNKLHSKKDITFLLNKIFDKIELLGPLSGKLLSNKLALYESKMKSPPLRVYYTINEKKKQAYLIDFEMKSDGKKQKKTIGKIKKDLESN